MMFILLIPSKIRQKLDDANLHLHENFGKE